jgi:endonuclease VIII
MRIILERTNALAVAFNVPVAEFLSARDLLRHTQLRTLGPDPLDPSFDRAEAVHGMHAHAGDAIADVLLNQRVIAGLGNVFKSEVLFVAGVDPFRKVGVLSQDELQRVIDAAKKLLASSVMSPSQTLRRGIGRRTTRSMNPAANLWVYGRAGKPCRRCGSLVRAAKSGLDARLTYWCPACQG